VIGSKKAGGGQGRLAKNIFVTGSLPDLSVRWR
jgi:hypothetical protein